MRIASISTMIPSSHCVYIAVDAMRWWYIPYAYVAISALTLGDAQSACKIVKENPRFPFHYCHETVVYRRKVTVNKQKRE